MICSKCGWTSIRILYLSLGEEIYELGKDRVTDWLPKVRSVIVRANCGRCGMDVTVQTASQLGVEILDNWLHFPVKTALKHDWEKEKL